MWPLFRQARYLARYRQIVGIMADYGLGVLIEQFGIVRLLALPRRILRRPRQAPSMQERLRLALVALGPTWIKLGQMLSTRPDIVPASYLEQLNQLQDTVPPFPSEEAIAIIEADLGEPIDRLFASFERAPFAAASLGQVHAAVLHSGEQVVVKVQRPDIQQLVATDLAILAELAAVGQQRSELGERYNLVDLAWEFSTMLRAELDFRQEGRNAERFRRNFAGNPHVHIPTIYWRYTSARVLTSERLFGIKINDIAAMDQAGMDRRALARHSTELILQEIFKDGYFQGDPHPGNMFALPGQVIGAVDFGQAVVLEPEMTHGLLLLLVALSRRNADEALRALQRLGMLTVQELTPVLRRDMLRFIDGIVDRPLAEMSARETGEELFALVQRHRLRMPAPLALLLKAIIMMEGIGMLIDPDLDGFDLARPYALQVLAESASPEAGIQRLLLRGRELIEAADTLPLLGTALQQLTSGDLSIQTRERELQRVALAQATAGARIATAIVLLASTVGLGLLAIAMAIGGWAGPLPVVLAVAGGLMLVTSGGALLVSLLRGH
jgi:ubiquinone biosynthesis protein